MSRDTENAIIALARNLVNKLRLIHGNTEYKGVWELYSQHVPGGYQGPQYCIELSNLETMLNQLDKEKETPHRSVCISTSGDTSVGVFPTRTHVDLGIPFSTKEERDGIRKLLSDTFSEIFDEPAHVVFDDECYTCVNLLGEDKKCHNKDCIESRIGDKNTEKKDIGEDE